MNRLTYECYYDSKRVEFASQQSVYRFLFEFVVAFVVVMFALSVSAARASEVAGVAVNAEDTKVLTHLENLIEAPLVHRKLGQNVTTETLLSQTRDWPESYVVVIDTRNRTVFVLRKRDGTVLSRAMDATLSAKSSYAVAFVATELLGIARHIPRRAEEMAKASLKERELPSFITFSLWMGANLNVNPDHEVFLLQPVLGGWVLFGGRYSPVWLSVGATLSAFGSFSRDVNHNENEKSYTVEYQSTDTALRFALGQSMSGFSFVESLWIGLSFTRLAIDPSQERLRDNTSQESVFLGAGIELRRDITRQFRFFVAADGIVIPQPTRYLLDGQKAIEIGVFRLVASLGLCWETD